jgi:hypothetical protein
MAYLRRVIDTVRRGPRGRAKIIDTKTLIVPARRVGPAGAET